METVMKEADLPFFLAGPGAALPEVAGMLLIDSGDSLTGFLLGSGRLFLSLIGRPDVENELVAF